MCKLSAFWSLCSLCIMYQFLQCVTQVYFAINRWDYWASSEFNERQKCPLHCDLHRTSAVTSEILSTSTHKSCHNPYQTRTSSIIITILIPYVCRWFQRHLCLPSLWGARCFKQTWPTARSSSCSMQPVALASCFGLRISTSASQAL